MSAVQDFKQFVGILFNVGWAFLVLLFLLALFLVVLRLFFLILFVALIVFILLKVSRRARG